jgi:signal peptidase I
VPVSALFILWLVFLAPTQIGGPVSLGVVKGTSMQPSLQTDDLVVAYEMPSYRIGDVIVYDKFGGSIVHEIVGAPNIGVFRTEGIHNNHLDSWNVRTSDIRGKVLFVIPKLGGFFVLLGTNPLFAGAAGVLVAAGVLLPSRKPKYSERLKNLLIHSAQEQRRIKPSAALVITLLWVLVIASIAATVLQLIQGLPLFPRVSWSLVAMSTAFAILIGFWEFNGDGRNLKEPSRSIAVLGPVLRRIPGDVQVETSNVQVVELPSAYKLRDVKEHLNLPVLHQIQLKPVVHSFYVVTDELIYVWRVALDNQSTVADSEDQHLRRVLSTERNNRDE